MFGKFEHFSVGIDGKCRETMPGSGAGIENTRCLRGGSGPEQMARRETRSGGHEGWNWKGSEMCVFVV